MKTIESISKIATLTVLALTALWALLYNDCGFALWCTTKVVAIALFYAFTQLFHAWRDDKLIKFYLDKCFSNVEF